MTIAARHIDITTEEITCANGMPAFLAYPTGGGRFPTVVLMHERYGLVKHFKDQAMRCARDGFAVLAPNFFFRDPDQKTLNAGDHRYDMTDPESIELIGEALAAMKSHKAADPDKVVVMGYCQTGRHPLLYAAEHPITAAVVWYGGAGGKEWDINKDQPKKLEDIPASLTRLGKLMGTESVAEPAAQDLRKRLAALQARYAKRPVRRPAVSRVRRAQAGFTTPPSTS